jgi:hypothetical protein
MNVVKNLIRRIRFRNYQKRKASIRSWERKASAFLESEIADSKNTILMLRHQIETQSREIDLLKLEVNRMGLIYQRDNERVKTEMALQIRLREAEQPTVNLGR